MVLATSCMIGASIVGCWYTSASCSHARTAAEGRRAAFERSRSSDTITYGGACSCVGWVRGSGVVSVFMCGVLAWVGVRVWVGNVW